MRIPRSFPMLGFIFLASAAVWGQSTPPPSDKSEVVVGNNREPKVDKSRQRDLKGMIMDPSDHPLDGAIVQLKDLRNGKIVDFRTKEDGKYLFYDLNMDQDYELHVIKDGFAPSATKKLTRYDTRKPANLDFVLVRAKT